jgi:hypothetical protein
LCLHNPYAELAEEETKMFMSVKILRGEWAACNVTRIWGLAFGHHLSYPDDVTKINEEKN